MINYQEEIQKTLLQLGAKQSYMGYKFIVYGVLNTINDINCLKYISKSLYVDIARKYNTTWQCVERNIRTVVSVIWKTSDQETLKIVCGNRIIQKPKNKEFFIILADYIVKNCAQEKERNNNLTNIDNNIPIIMQQISTQLKTITNVLIEIPQKINEANDQNKYISECISLIEKIIKQK